MRIMVVDDMGSMRMQIKKILEELGFNPNDVLQMPDGSKAYKKILALSDIPGQQVGLCISDWNMEPVNGLQLLQLIRKHERVRELPFVMLTAEQSQANIISAIQSGADEYIIKPFNMDTLKKKLDNVANKKLQVVNKEFKRYFARDDSDNALDSITDEKADKLIKFFGSKYVKITCIAPWSPLGSMSIGKMYMHFKRYGGAEVQFRKAISIDFGFAKAHEQLSKSLRAQNKIADSSKELEVALAVKPNSPALRQQLGETYLKEGNYKKAIMYLSQAVEQLDGDAGQAQKAKSLSSLGQAKIVKGEKEQDMAALKDGLQDSEKAVALDPELVSAQFNLMVAYKKTGQKDKALKIFERIKDTEAEDAEGWVKLGVAFLERDEKPKALFAFSKAEAMAVHKFQAFEDIAFALYRHNHHKEAEAYNLKMKEENPSSKECYNLGGLIQRALGENKKAVSEYEHAIKLAPGDAGLYFNLGVACLKMNQEARANKYFGQAIDLEPKLATKVDEARSKNS